MPLSAQLFLQQPAGAVRIGEVGARSLTLGRSPSSDLVFADARVSWQHTTFAFESGVLWVKDLGSRNGTFVNGERVTSPRVVADGDRVGIGPDITLAVEFVGSAPVLMPQALTVEDVASGVRYPMRSERFTIGEGGDIAAPGAGATLLLTGPEDLWLGIDGEDRPLRLDEPFDVDGRGYVVRQASLDRSPTFEAPAEPGGRRAPYALEASLNGEGGAEATVIDEHLGRAHRVEGENRALLLYVLGRRALTDADAGVSSGERGWLTDDDASVAIWGRAQAGRDPNALHVLIHRVRKELAAAGLDPWFIEKRRKCVRGRFARVELR